MVNIKMQHNAILKKGPTKIVYNKSIGHINNFKIQSQNAGGWSVKSHDHKHLGTIQSKSSKWKCHSPRRWLLHQNYGHRIFRQFDLGRKLFQKWLRIDKRSQQWCCFPTRMFRALSLVDTEQPLHRKGPLCQIDNAPRHAYVNYKHCLSSPHQIKNRL